MSLSQSSITITVSTAGIFAAAIVSSLHLDSVILIAVVSNLEVSNIYGFSSAVLLEALALVMFNNRMRFGDIVVKQISKIAKGMSPVPTIAKLYVAIYEEAHVLKYLPAGVLHLCHFINDGLGVWFYDPDPVAAERNWREFQDCRNTSGLKWIFSEQSQEVVFMDLWLKIIRSSTMSGTTLILCQIVLRCMI